jgi:putative tricarboxylic transport membrane protein
MNSEKQKNWIDLIVSCSIYVLTAAVFFLSSSFKATADNSLNPDVWPRIICVLLCIVATIQLVNVLRGKLSTHVTVANKKEVFCAIGLIILYGVFLKRLGYILCSVILMVCLLFLFRTKKVWVYFVLPIVTVLLSYYLFHSLLRVPLPAGVLSFLG